MLLAKKISVPQKYIDFLNVFSKKSAEVLFNYLDINIHAINLEADKKPPYRPIYSLDPVKLEIFKAYIETNLANGLI